MHIVMIVAVLLAAGYILTRILGQKNNGGGSDTQQSGLASQGGVEQANPGLAVAFLSDGKLFYKAAGGELKQIHSQYIQEVTDKLERSKERHAWKQNTSFSVSANGGMRQFNNDGPHIVATSLQFDQDKTVLYFLKDDGIGGLFAYDLESGVEKRILHKQNLNLSDLNLNVATGKILCSSSTKQGVANLAMLGNDGNQFQELTGGDTLDSAPAWIPGADKKILYQSTGIGRDQNGYAVAHGNSTIQMLDMGSGNVTPVMEDPNYDFLHPRVSPQGNLHFIRRPYEMPKYEAGNALLDILLFPFRLLRAVFHFLNFFSLMYSRKPLTSASGPAVSADIKNILLKGKRIDAEKALRQETNVNGVPSLVPKSWQLISRDRQGVERVLASNVVSYDITPEGKIIYSNGRGVFLLLDNAESRLILRSDVVTDVIAKSDMLQSAAVW
ncbi:hypothetical protein [Undibacterium sp.]|uniref:hypothetical protein n=1 Tax=Undibacterium sp. TaxID=1914977 RepID=UPI00374DE2FB